MNPFPRARARTRGHRADGIASECSTHVVVLGGGPAGTSTSLALTARGWSVTILERSHYESTRIGETFPPEVRRPLLDLGLWREFLAEGPIESPGIAAAWGRPDLYDNDFIVNPHGPGWHVDRRRFDSMLARAAAARGIELLQGARRIAVVRNSSARWDVEAMVDGRRWECRAAVIVDATGRSASPIRRHAGRRVMCDRLVGLVGFTPAARPGGDRRTLIEAVECGWWYSSAPA